MNHRRTARPLLHSTELSEHVRLEGDLETTMSLLVKGEFSGSIRSDAHVTIAPEAVLTSCTLVAGSVAVEGSFHGSMKASGTVELEDGALVEGDLQAAVLRIRRRARFQGRISMSGQSVRERRLGD
jgi:cytoskeletal protein CcmA (bactofilin family)